MLQQLLPVPEELSLLLVPHALRQGSHRAEREKGLSLPGKAWMGRWGCSRLTKWLCLSSPPQLLTWGSCCNTGCRYQTLGSKEKPKIMTSGRISFDYKPRCAKDMPLALRAILAPFLKCLQIHLCTHLSRTCHPPSNPWGSTPEYPSHSKQGTQHLPWKGAPRAQMSSEGGSSCPTEPPAKWDKRQGPSSSYPFHKAAGDSHGVTIAAVQVSE